MLGGALSLEQAACEFIEFRVERNVARDCGVIGRERRVALDGHEFRPLMYNIVKNIKTFIARIRRNRAYGGEYSW